MKKLGLLLTFPLLLAACDTTNPSLTPVSRAPVRPKLLEAVTLDDDAPKVTFNPKVDIVFVIDNSDSMAYHLKHLAENIKMFTDELSKNKFVDFHIAFTYVHDRSFPQFCGPNQDNPGRQNYDNPGTLQPIEGITGRRFVTNKDDFATALNSTFDKLKIPTFVPYHPWEPNKCAIGPENEESVTPLLALFDTRLTMTNAGFRRHDAKFVGIFVSDAKDAAIAAGLKTIAGVLEEMGQLTNSTPNKRNFRLFAVAVKPGSVQKLAQISYDGEASCKPDPAFQIPDGRVDKHGRPTAQWPNERIIKPEDSPLAELAMATEDKGADRIDQVLSICSLNYGKQLALYGARIQMDALEDKQIILNAPPQIFAKGTKQAKDFGLQVLIDDTPLAKDQWRGEIINGQYTITIFAKKVDWNSHPNGKITVKYVKVNVNSPDARPID